MHSTNVECVVCNCKEVGCDLIEHLLQPNPAKRLGMLSGGSADVWGHRFCAEIDMGKLHKKELRPPFVPKLSDPTDTSNFDNLGEPPSGKEYDKYLDKKYESTWEREFGG